MFDRSASRSLSVSLVRLLLLYERQPGNGRCEMRTEGITMSRGERKNKRELGNAAPGSERSRSLAEGSFRTSASASIGRSIPQAHISNTSVVTMIGDQRQSIPN
jgi:hypothetical protein